MAGKRYYVTYYAAQAWYVMDRLDERDGFVKSYDHKRSAVAYAEKLNRQEAACAGGFNKRMK